MSFYCDVFHLRDRQATVINQVDWHRGQQERLTHVNQTFSAKVWKENCPFFLQVLLQKFLQTLLRYIFPLGQRVIKIVARFALATFGKFLRNVHVAKTT